MSNWELGATGELPYSCLKTATAPPSSKRKKTPLPILTATYSVPRAKNIIKDNTMRDIKEAHALTVQQLKFIELDFEATNNPLIMSACAKHHNIQTMDAESVKEQLSELRNALEKAIKLFEDHINQA